ncbi:MAG: class I SAM-dependent rRNA methyltransferase [Acidimicrobiia bacterium]
MLAPATLRLRAGRERSLRRRHPWIFSGSVARVAGRPAPGDTVAVEAADGTFLAWAAYSPSSQIVARVWSFDEGDVIDDVFVANRITASARRRDPLTARTDGARLVFSEADGVPGLIADRYGAHVITELTTAGAERWRDTIADALAALPGIEGVYERSDVDMRQREGLEQRVGLMRGSEPPELLTFVEDGATYYVDVRRGHKTGFYLDQRESRRAVADLAAGRRMLNVFAYTGAFAVVAARAGATSTTSIDSSGPALALAARNLECNGCPPGELVEADAFADLRRLRAQSERYDLIVLDPPKLAHRADQVERSTRAYKDINLIAFQLLDPGGILVTFSCSGLLDELLFQKVVAGAALDARREARIIGRLHQASDHPVHLAIPETAYLKGLVCQVD